MLSNLKISHKFILMSAIQILLIIVLGWFSIIQMNKIGNEIKEIAHDHLPLNNTLTLITEHQLQQAIAFEKVVSHALLDKVEGKGLSAESESLINNLNKKIKLLHDEILDAEATIVRLKDEVHSAEAKEEYEHVLTEYKLVEEEFFAVENMILLFLDQTLNDGIEKTLDTIVNIEKANKKLDDHLVAVLNEVQEFSLNSAKTAYQDEQNAIKVIALVLCIALALAIIVPIIIGRSVIKPLKNLILSLEDLASGEGDLTKRLSITSKDELGRVSRRFDTFICKLHKIIINVAKSTSSLNQSSESAIEVVQNTLDNVENQKLETELVASSVEQMSMATAEVAQSTMNASEIANKVRGLVSKGKTAALENQRITSKLSEDVQLTSDSIRDLVKETDNIGSVLDTIQGIAEQTNLLALNAAIEAARAGESGRGFAVVADEVRSLAQRTQTSTVDIQNLVESLQNGAEIAMEKMNKGVKATEECLQIGKETAEHFDNAVLSVNEIADLNTQIAAAAEEQSTVAAQIQSNVENIKNISQDTTQNANKVSEANDNIAKNVIHLNSDLNQFKI
ncbi:methyl-accepting chemotaxis protein [Marinomonas sp. THO17]|uniref:methyl-accepting chemotaxis protein n=1 Tax=Marinomonas sp. THO17 TaxID=3149048 RepID=UPI00336BF251